jgi:hypothetical protein
MHTLVNKQRHLLDIPAAALQRCKYSNKKDKKNKKTKKEQPKPFYTTLGNGTKNFLYSRSPNFP